MCLGAWAGRLLVIGVAPRSFGLPAKKGDLMMTLLARPTNLRGLALALLLACPILAQGAGRDLLDAMIFDVLARTPPGPAGELQLTDAIAIAALALPLTALRFSGIRHDCANTTAACRVERPAGNRQDGGPPDPLVQVLSGATAGAIHARIDGSDQAARPAVTTAFGR